MAKTLMNRYYATPAYGGGYYITDRETGNQGDFHKDSARCQYELDKLNNKLFPMQDGPDIPWWLGELIWETLYAKVSPASARDQDARRIAERGGFSWEEVSIMWKNLKKKRKV